jgi:hypothetical protein
MLPFGVTIPATVPQGSEIPEGLKNNPVYLAINLSRARENPLFYITLRVQLGKVNNSVTP